MTKYTESKVEGKKKTVDINNKHKIMCSDCGRFLGYVVESKKIENSTYSHKYLCICVCGHDCFPVTINCEYMKSNGSIFTNDGYFVSDVQYIPSEPANEEKSVVRISENK